MPGGMGGGPGGPGGGIGGVAGMLMRGVMGGRGPGGPGGGMGAPSAGGQAGGGQNSGSVSDVYDVDRWKRADDLDSGYEPTLVQTVRDAWERETLEKKKHSLAARVHTLFHRGSRKESRRSIRKRERRMERRAKGAPGRQDDYEKDRSFEDAERDRESAREKGRGEERPNRVRAASGAERPRGTLEGNTIITPGMRKASHHIPEGFPGGVDRTGDTAGAYPGRLYHRTPLRCPIGLTTRAGIDSFFSSSPLNSTLLAVDSLSFGPLTLNQVRQQEVAVSSAGGLFSSSLTGHDPADAVPDYDFAAEEGLPADTAHGAHRPAVSGHGGARGTTASLPGVSAGGSVSHGNLITEHTGASYMNALREHREHRKYDVRTRNH